MYLFNERFFVLFVFFVDNLRLLIPERFTIPLVTPEDPPEPPLRKGGMGRTP